MIRTLILDLDGVLTDGKQYITSDGSKLFKAFHSRDIRAIRETVAVGIEVIVLSADDWPGAVTWCHSAGASFYNSRDKMEWVTNAKLNPIETAVIGDDSWDIPLLNWTQYAFAPMDSDPAVGLHTHAKQLRVCGGQGVVAEFVRVFLGAMI